MHSGRLFVFVGTTTYAVTTALRPAIVNWQTDTHDVDLLVDVTRELTKPNSRSVADCAPAHV